MFFVGLTGGIATGKSTVLAIFRKHGIAVIDADEVSRQVMEKGTNVSRQLGEEFGEVIFTEDGSINRSVLAEIVFSDAQKRKRLNAITHPKIQRAIIKTALRYFYRGHMYVVMELPLLFETGRMYNFMHKIITVACEDHQQLERLCKRNNLSREVALPRIDSQMPLAEKIAKSDFVIDNSGDFRKTKQQTFAIITKLEDCKYGWYIKNAATFILGPIFVILILMYVCNVIKIFFF